MFLLHKILPMQMKRRFGTKEMSTKVPETASTEGINPLPPLDY
jgi:hypothetical protein